MKILFSIASFISFVTSAALAAPCAPVGTGLVGHYYLEGVLEVGSELLLRPDGSFEYMLSYGNVDQVANGCWSQNGEVVSLTSSGTFFKPQAFKQQDLKVNTANGLVVDMGNGIEGIYAIH
ncbi:hypothetical protein AB4Y96_16380 [Phyllobacterium sp. TAF24]|uniref:hypothetical protein n=1 Tax=Phyllobacterium sp. TAF24 TaxID=3233068 RepID=UPI003F99D7CC